MFKRTPGYFKADGKITWDKAQSEGIAGRPVKLHGLMKFGRKFRSLGVRRFKCFGWARPRWCHESMGAGQVCANPSVKRTRVPGYEVAGALGEAPWKIQRHMLLPSFIRPIDP